VVDLIYRPARTRLLQRAEEAGLQVQNGLPMLVQQGAEAFAVWTGREPPLEVMRRAAGELLQQ
jgi:shikimate dehydrogenase